MDKLDEKIGISTGLNLDLEREQATDTDWVFGALSQPCKINIPVGERRKYLPDGEIQHLGVDKQDCATRGPINILEAKFTYGVQNKVFSEENIAWLKQKGYADVNGRVTFSDRWIAIISGTTRQGNSMKAPIDAIHRYGLIPKSMFPQVHSWEEYYDNSKITNGMYALASEFKSRFDIYYEKVYPVHFSDALNDDLLNVAGHAWPRAENGIYPKTTNPINHDFVNAEKPDFVAFDNYIDPVDGDFYKQLAADYIFFEWGYRIFIEENSPQKRASSLADSINDSHQNWSFIRKLADAFTQALADLKKWLEVKAPINELQPIIENNEMTFDPKPIEKPKYEWDTPEKARHSVRVICDEELLSVKDKNDLCATVGAESGWNPRAIGKVNPNGTRDYGICQINTKYWIGQGKQFPSTEYVLDNPEVCIRWMCKQWKAGNKNWWIAYKNGSYKAYL